MPPPSDRLPLPELGNQYRDDRVLRDMLARTLPADLRWSIDGELDELGEIAADAWRTAREHPPALPVLTQWRADGERIDRIDVTPAWREGPRITARYGLLAAGRAKESGAFARIDQFARVYLYHASSAFFTCPLAMSDGAVSALLESGNSALASRAVPRLLSRDPATLWLSGQWMTERAGGSDVGSTETIARREPDGRWRLHGRKWFTSAIVGDMALTLARPESAAGTDGALALFYLETRDAEGRWNGITIDRLKDKLGTRELPTAEITLSGTLAEPVAGLTHGVRNITPVLNMSRLWNAVGAIASMRRCLALAIDYARRRRAFGHRLIELPAHRATLAALAAEFEAAFGFVFFVIGILGRCESGRAEDGDAALLRILTPLAKLWTGKLAVHTASETCETFGGAGYIEDTGIPELLRDAQVYPIWEGTTNVLALDALRAIGEHGFDALETRAGSLVADGDPAGAKDALARARTWLEGAAGNPDVVESGARGFALTLARGFAAAVLTRAAEAASGAQANAALTLFAAHGLDRLSHVRPDTIANLLDT